MSKTITLSAVITAHREGLKLHKTILSVLESCKELEKNKYLYEIIIHIDKGDKDTVNYLKRYLGNDKFRIFQNSFGDLGTSRNFSAQKALGKYIAFIDGDDLISPNWFLSGLKALESSKQDIIVHPEAVLTFGSNQPNILTIQKSTSANTIEQDVTTLISANRWTSVIMAKKSTLIKTPYRALINNDGYGFEDYIFNIETIQNNIHHKIVPKTVLFYRVSPNSMRLNYNSEFATIPYSKLFDLNTVKKFHIPKHEIKKEQEPEQKLEQNTTSTPRKVYKKIRNNNFLNYFITPFAKLTLKTLSYFDESKSEKVKPEPSPTPKTIIPEFVIKEWANINKIETQLYPQQYHLDRVSLYNPENEIATGHAFCKLAKCVSKTPDYVFIVPWIVRGGADKVLFNYIKALHEIHPDWHFAVIATLAADHVWASKLPKDYVDFIDFGNISHDVWKPSHDLLFTRFIIQLQCPNLHIINSQFGYNWASHHMNLIKEHFTLNVSLFCGEFIPESNMKGWSSYADPELFNIYPIVNKIFTDNAAIIDKTIDLNGFDKNKFKIHYQPIPQKELMPYRKSSEKDKFRIIWASRVAKPKIPHIPVEIAKKLDPEKFQIDVYGEICDGIEKNIFDDIPALEYRGVYNGFSNLDTSMYDLFLYTALDDGVPNAILEAAAAGLPIIASNDGGVSEFIHHEKTGILIDDPTDIKAYVKAINYAEKHRQELEKYTKNATELLEKQHSWKALIKSVKKDFK